MKQHHLAGLDVASTGGDWRRGHVGEGVREQGRKPWAEFIRCAGDETMQFLPRRQSEQEL